MAWYFAYTYSNCMKFTKPPSVKISQPPLSGMWRCGEYFLTDYFSVVVIILKEEPKNIPHTSFQRSVAARSSTALMCHTIQRWFNEGPGTLFELLDYMSQDNSSTSRHGRNWTGQERLPVVRLKPNDPSFILPLDSFDLPWFQSLHLFHCIYYFFNFNWMKVVQVSTQNIFPRMVSKTF